MKIFRKPWRFQISLRAVMAFVTALTVIFAMASYQRRLNAVQERAFAEISGQGGHIYVRTEGTSIYFQQPLLMCGNGIKRVIGGSGSAVDFGDNDVVHFADVIRLRSIDLAGTSVSEAGIEKIRRNFVHCRVHE